MMKINKNSIKNIFKSRSFVYGGPSLVLIAIVLCISIAVVLLSDSLLSFKLDMTQDKLYTLSDTTKGILKDLNQDVTVYKLFSQSDLDQFKGTPNAMNMALTMLDELSKYTNRIKYVTVDPDTNPKLINELDPTGAKSIQKNEVVFKSGNQVKNVSIDVSSNMDENQNYIIEQTYAGALKEVTREKIPVVYIINGHGEGSIDTNYNSIKLGFSQNGYEIKSLPNLSQRIPDDAVMVVDISPTTDLLSDDEAYVLTDYLVIRGGKGAFLFDPVIPDASFPRYNKVLKDYNIAVKNSVIYEKDPNNYAPGQEQSLLLKLEGGPIFDSAQVNNIQVSFNKATELDDLKGANLGGTTTKWFYTSDQSVSTPINSAEASTTGSFPIIISSEYTKENITSRIFVCANSSFVNESSGYGIMLFGGLTNWLQGEKTDDISIAGKTGTVAEFSVNQITSDILQYTLELVIPVIIVLLGIVVWLKRRHL